MSSRWALEVGRGHGTRDMLVECAGEQPYCRFECRSNMMVVVVVCVLGAVVLGVTGVYNVV